MFGSLGRTTTPFAVPPRAVDGQAVVIDPRDERLCNTDHAVAVESVARLSGHVGVCRCGWRSVPTRTPGAAVRRWLRHEEKALR